MPTLSPHLALPRCPHCSTDNPTLSLQHNFATKASDGTNERSWHVYKCSRCGGAVTAAGRGHGHPALEVYPSARTVDADIPPRVRDYLSQALLSLSAPAGAVMLAASAVDAMLKEKGLRDGSLYSRIDAAVSSNIITADMAGWAHDVRLDANDQRHSDEAVALPSPSDAKRSVEFALALADVLFTFPARVRRGRAQATEGKPQRGPA